MRCGEGGWFGANGRALGLRPDFAYVDHLGAKAIGGVGAFSCSGCAPRADRGGFGTRRGWTWCWRGDALLQGDDLGGDATSGCRPVQLLGRRFALEACDDLFPLLERENLRDGRRLSVGENFRGVEITDNAVVFGEVLLDFPGGFQLVVHRFDEAAFAAISDA